MSSDSGFNGYRTNGGNSGSNVSGTWLCGGGSGAYGGNAGGDFSSGGGGGSGYTNGAVTITQARQGGGVQNFSAAIIELP